MTIQNEQTAYGILGAVLGTGKGIANSIADAAPAWELIFQTAILAAVGSITAILIKYLQRKFFPKKS